MPQAWVRKLMDHPVVVPDRSAVPGGIAPMDEPPACPPC
jgi:hypothetical protein